MEKSSDRLAILKKIDEYEKNQWFDRDVEDDPPTVPLKPGEADYTGAKFSSRVKTAFANVCATLYFDNKIRKRELIIERVEGIENFTAVKGGAFITCNHFNAYDNYAVWTVIKKYCGRRRLYKVVREGNFTSFGGLFGFFFRNCNTLPLSSSIEGMKEFLSGVSALLKRGEKILIYPEQGMWWNYKKPRPLKTGAFNMAAENGAPIIPVFITMRDSDKIGSDGFPIQAYTLNFFPALYPDKNLTARENRQAMKAENFRLWKEKYEDVYGVPLKYSAED